MYNIYNIYIYLYIFNIHIVISSSNLAVSCCKIKLVLQILWSYNNGSYEKYICKK